MKCLQSESVFIFFVIEILELFFILFFSMIKLIQLKFLSLLPSPTRVPAVAMHVECGSHLPTGATGLKICVAQAKF